ncbi:MAG TPA: TetR/AcrR family transcriptional regulator [Solimonas sp.]|nr:TetR/AcrR family transcriptional regulator [Solimonas sp.]
MAATKITPSPIVPATARGEATRRRLLDAAEKEFGEKGYHAASVSSITTRAGVGQGTFYLYFHSKEEIFSTLVRDIGHSVRKHMAQAVSKNDHRMDAERAGLDAFFEFAQQHPGLYRIVQECQFVDEPVFRDYYERLAAGYSKGIAEATQRGELAPGDADVRAWAIMGIGHFIGMRHCLWQGQQPNRSTLDQLMGFIGEGMAPRKPR